MSKAQVTFPSAPDTSAIDIQDAGVLIVSNPGTMNFTGAGVTVTENPTGTAEVDIPGVQYWTESESAATQQNTRWIPNNSAANVTAVIQPKGTGANTAQRPDGTTAGGNARGNYATDWQKIRANATEVASGAESTIIGGVNNRASGIQSTAGGDSSTASGTESTAIGRINAATGNRSLAIGGEFATASGTEAAVIAGNANTASGNRSLASGVLTTASGNMAWGRGNYGRAYAAYQFATGANGEGAGVQLGAQQISTVPIANNLNDSYTTGQIITIGTLTPPDNNRAYNVIAECITVVISISGTATGITVGDYMVQNQLFGFKRVAGTGSITSITTVATHGDASITGTAAFLFDVSSNNLRARLTAPTFAGGGSIVLRTCIKFEFVEIAWTV